MSYLPDQDTGPRTADSDGQRHCLQGEWCRGYRIEDGQRRPALTPRPFCEPCERHAVRCISELPDLHGRLRAELGSKGPGHGERVSQSREAPLPLRLDIDALMRDIAAVLASWDERVRDTAGLYYPGTALARRRRDHVTVGGGAGTLADHFTVLASLPAETMTRDVELDGILPGDTGVVHASAGYATVNRDLSGPDGVLELLRLHRRARGVLGETRVITELASPCPRCSCITLIRVSGEDRLRCTSCGHDPEDQAYSDWVKQLAGSAWYITHMATRLEPLLRLAAGWDGHRARPVTRQAADGMHAAVQVLMRPEFAPPQYFPLPAGGLQAEWAAGIGEVTVTVAPDGTASVLAEQDGETVTEGDLAPGEPVAARVRPLLAVLSKRIYQVMGVKPLPPRVAC